MKKKREEKKKRQKAKKRKEGTMEKRGEKNVRDGNRRGILARTETRLGDF